ncbi:MAG: hypothetical protein V4819_17725 [Verrucomicrobiota bacterium]
MPLSREAIEKRAVKTGVKASIKRDHLVTEQELLALRVQTMPTFLRVSLVLTGILSLASCWIGWPSDSFAVRVLEALWGVFAVLFGSFGVRRTLSHLLDSVDAIDLVGSILEMIADAVSNFDL